MFNLTPAQRMAIFFLIDQLTQERPLPASFDSDFSLQLQGDMATSAYLINQLRESDLQEVRTKATNIDRDWASGYERLMQDYFATTPTYTDRMFKRRFRMQRHLFKKIVNDVTRANEYFTQRRDATGLLGLSPVQKVTTAIRMLAYDSSADQVDEVIRLGESTTLKCLKEFCRTIVELYGEEYLRKPTARDLERILRHSRARGFPGMMGSLDCMHWEWKNCPRAWAGQYRDWKKKNTIILEAVATYDLWIWHANFGSPGSLNDTNVLDQSPLFDDLDRGVSPEATFQVAGRTFKQPYYLVDGIYPAWPIFMSAIKEPGSEKRSYFTMMQEAARKDVERAFGVLRARWGILRNPVRLWDRSSLSDVMTCCIILHNMVVEDEQEDLLTGLDDEEEVAVINRSHRDPTTLFLERFATPIKNFGI